MNLAEFVSHAGGSGPCVGIYPQGSGAPALPAAFELRTIKGEQTRTLEPLYDAFAQAWDFPAWFGRNSHAFDDFMRDLDNMIDAEYGKPPAPGYFTIITDAHLILADQPEAFPWFAKCMPFYRDYYRDEADPRATFGLLLTAPSDQLDRIRQRWLSAGVPIADLSSPV